MNAAESEGKKKDLEKGTGFGEFWVVFEKWMGPEVGRQDTLRIALKSGFCQISLAVLEGPCQKIKGLKRGIVELKKKWVLVWSKIHRNVDFFVWVFFFNASGVQKFVYMPTIVCDINE